VAGVASPVVTALGGATSARSVVVRFDPALDVAVLRVAGLPVPPAPTGPDPDPAQSVALVGYPEGGAQRVLPARVRGTVEATGEDLYGRAGVHRPVVVLAAGVEPGDSGGPVLGADGRILGLVFAATIDRVGQTGYALPLSAVAPLLPGAAQAPALVTADLPSDCPGERR
jgi:S1-C subfamily serine protease